MAELKCPACGSIVPTEARYCSNCGRQIGQVAGTSEGQSTSAVNRRRDYGLLLILIVTTILIFNLLRPGDNTDLAAVETPTLDTSFEGIVNLGNTFMDRGLYDHAVQQYRKALEVDSLHPEIMVDLGACYHALGEYDEAVYQFNRALALDPRQPVAIFNMGVVQLSLGDTTATRQWWRRYLEVADQGPQADMVRQRLEEL